MPYGSVLIVDDVVSNIYVAKGLLSPYELYIDSALDGFEAIRKIREGEVYDIIFMDHLMPMLDGIETTTHLRYMGYNRPVVALTANVTAGRTEILLGNGFNDVLSKPVDICKLNYILNKYIRDKQPPGVIERARELAEKKKNYILENDRKAFLDNKIDGLDIAKGLERYNGNLKVYTSIMRTYATDIRALLETIEDINEESLNSYKITIHEIKGASFDIFANHIGETAKGLESAACNRELGYVIKHNPAFLRAAHKLLDQLDSLLSGLNTEIKKPTQDRSDSISLTKLLTGCNRFNADEETRIISYNTEYYKEHSTNGSARRPYGR